MFPFEQQIKGKELNAQLLPLEAGGETLANIGVLNGKETFFGSLALGSDAKLGCLLVITLRCSNSGEHFVLHEAISKKSAAQLKEEIARLYQISKKRGE
jgi:hypothetical protein